MSGVAQYHLVKNEQCNFKLKAGGKISNECFLEENRLEITENNTFKKNSSPELFRWSF